MKVMSALLVLVFSSLVYSQSAVRLPHEDWKELAQAAEASVQNSEKILDSSAQNVARPWQNTYFYDIPRWNSYDLQAWFQEIRDDRYLQWSGQRNMKRRLTWLYPQDGCFARANMIVRRMRDKKRPIPKKIFVFGNLWFHTPYAPGGKVGWWYHVAPIVDVNGISYVLDPAMDFHRPLRVNEWLAHMGNPYEMKIAVCGAGTYMPINDCDRKQVRNLGKQPIMNFMTKEWDSLEELGHDPERLLGDLPPWRY